MKLITFLTDFGLKDGYVAQMKGVASNITDARLIDITHEITPHDVYGGSFVLRSIVPYFPIGTVHVAIVDPGVGTKRRGLVITTKKHVLVGPDNGLLMPAAHFLGEYIVYEILNEEYMLNSISSTFHGRDIFTPVAAHITMGVPFDEIGSQISDYIDLDFGQGKIKDHVATGKVIHIDHFGNIITNISHDIILKGLKYDTKIMVYLKKHSLSIPFVQSYGFVKKRDLLASIGSSCYFEIGVNQGNAAKRLSAKVGDDVEVLFG